MEVSQYIWFYKWDFSHTLVRFKIKIKDGTSTKKNLRLDTQKRGKKFDLG